MWVHCSDITEESIFIMLIMQHFIAYQVGKFAFVSTSSARIHRRLSTYRAFSFEYVYNFIL
jgi:hypothetical protein